MSAKVIQISTKADALALADSWQRQAQRLECLLILVSVQRDASELLLRIAQDELDRLRGLNDTR